MSFSLETERLHLRAWQFQDYFPFFEMNADPKVMQYFPKLLLKQESDALADRFQQVIQQHGWGFWAIELKATGQFIGFTGLHHQPSQFSFSPCTEIGWRLARQAWGQGYATEAAHACLYFAFHQLGLDRVVAFTPIQNRPSFAVMQRLKMQEIDRFAHPALTADHLLSAHRLCEIRTNDFKNPQNDPIIVVKNHGGYGLNQSGLVALNLKVAKSE